METGKGGWVGQSDTVGRKRENSRGKERKRAESTEKGCERGRKRVWRSGGEGFDGSR